MRVNIVFFILLSFFFSACEKEIKLETANVEPKLVVDGQIETNKPPIIILTKSMNYFSTFNATNINNLFVRNAKVTISNGTKTHQLKEYSFVQNGINFYFYTNDFSNPSSAFEGENGKSYTLTIETDGKSYTSTTQIPLLTKKIDSIWWKNAPPLVDSNLKSVMVKVTDPPGLGNYIRVFIQQGTQNEFLPADNSTFDDQVVDGKTYQVPISPGVDRNAIQGKGGDSSSYFLKGDTVTIKFCNTDKSTYLFWNTWEFAYSALGNPFSAPNKVLGNISGNALGAFCGYATQFKTVVIPK